MCKRIHELKKKPIKEVSAMVVNVMIQALLWMTSESYTNRLFALVIASAILRFMIYHYEHRNLKVFRIMYMSILGCLPPLLLLVAPHWALLAVFYHFINQLAANSRKHKHSSPRAFVISSSITWIICYIIFCLRPQSAIHNSVEAQLLFGDSHRLAQLIIGFFLGYITLVVGKNIKTEEADEHQSNLQETNNKLEKVNIELKQALAEKESLILRFSHEIRNPLNSLLGNIELAYEATHDSSTREMLRDAKVSSEILLQLLSNVLDSAKLELGGLDINKKSHNFRRFMEKAWIVCSQVIKAKGLFGSVSVNSAMPALVEFDSQRVMQILTNLVTNAVKFTGSGRVQIYADFEPGSELSDDLLKPRRFETNGEEINSIRPVTTSIRHEEFDEYPLRSYEVLTTKNMNAAFINNVQRHKLEFKGKRTNSAPLMQNVQQLLEPSQLISAETEGFIRFEIIDSGCGMSEADVSKLFKKYGQANAESNARHIGTGLGLWITKQLVEAMGGKIEVYSIPNHGTCFVVVLKSKSKPNTNNLFSLPSLIEMSLRTEPQQVSPQNILEDGVDFEKLNVLVVDDGAYNREVIQRFLLKAGVKNIDTATNGLEAVSKYEQKSQGYYSFVFMDIDMPLMNGKEATAKIREYELRHGWTKTTNIIMLTAFSDLKTQTELRDPSGIYKANCFISKPGSYDEIRNTIIKLL